MTKKLKIEDFSDLQSILNKLEELENKIDALIAKLNQLSSPALPFSTPIPDITIGKWKCNVCGLESDGPMGYYCARVDCPSGYVCSVSEVKL